MKTLVAIALALCSMTCSRKQVSLLDEGNSDLKTGILQMRTLKVHQADTFRLQLDKNAFVAGKADQQTVDVAITILGGPETLHFDGPATGEEPFYFETKTAGEYEIVVAPLEDKPGNYTIMVNSVDPIPADPVQATDQLLKVLAGTGKRPGAAVSVVKDGQLVYTSGFGYADLQYDIPITSKTIFHIASVSKQFTSFAIAMLVDQGKISLDDDIRKYLPEMHDFGTPITINHLVHHTSGLRDQWNLLALAGWRLDDVITQNQIMRVVSRQRELNFNPGDEYHYCNTGFTLMAEIVSRVSGQSFPDWTMENIFKPLHMDHTLFYNDHEKIVPNRAYSYHVTPKGFKKSVLSYANVGATSLFTTVDDLGLWATNFDKMTVGNEHVMKMMNQRFVLNKGDTIDYAFGHWIRQYKGLETISHSGSDAGYRTFLLRFPDQHLSISVFSNLASFNAGGTSYLIANRFLRDKLGNDPPKKQEPKKEEQSEPSFDKGSIRLQDYGGTFYSDELQTAYTMIVANDTLTAQHQRHDDIKLIPKGPDIFNSSMWFMEKVTFVRDSKGKVDGMKVSNWGGRNLKFSKHQ
ncbi:MAG: beta-lactamase family protein [Bacteroidetes bacterium]|nr:beta-lactamase family protein [Bacteroidota bacterium]